LPWIPAFADACPAGFSYDAPLMLTR
jgi:hypothetical protein